MKKNGDGLMIKLYKLFLIILTVIILLSSVSCTKKKAIPEGNSLNDQLNDLEKIIIKYEKIFSETAYGTQEYTDVVNAYNEEVGDWSNVFEVDRYEKNTEGKRLPTKEFETVKKRFIDLNSRMTKMILSTIPKKEDPSEENLIEEK